MCLSNLGGEEIAVNVLSLYPFVAAGPPVWPRDRTVCKTGHGFFYEIPVFYLIVQQIVIFK